MILIHGDAAAPLSMENQLGSLEQSLLLYPCDEADELTPDFIRRFGPIRNLIVPDGNWRSTSKMRRRIAGLSGVRAVKLPAGKPSNYMIRKETKREGLATIEAIARSFGLIDGPEVQAALEALLSTMVSRTLVCRGMTTAVSLKSVR